MLVLLLVSACGSKKPVVAEDLGGPESQAANLCGAKVEAEVSAPPLLEGMGSYHFAVSEQPLSQRYFDQAMVLNWGFNHAEAHRSFVEAARLDPGCAMCFWGAALALGPNINAKMDAANLAPALEAIGKAAALADAASPMHKALISALGKRYARDAGEDRSALDEAYALAMREVATNYPDDADVQTLFAESLMDQHPWDYWQKDGKPRPWTGDIVTVLERAMNTSPDHAGANHLYIHAIEASKDPGRALPSAKRLESIVPGAGHLVHMPSHIYIRIGQYHEGSEANERAIASDNQYSTQCHAQGTYPLLYTPHNWHFLWATSSLEGRSKRAIEAAKEVRKRVASESSMSHHDMGFMQHFFVTPLYAYARFGMWDEILAEAQPDAAMTYPNAVWHYARGMAFVGKRDLSAAHKELDALKELAKSRDLEKVTVFDINTTKQLMAVAIAILEGEMAAAGKNYKEAITRLEFAAELEGQLNYDEPPDWYYPVRHSLGAVYLEANRPTEAERVYRQDLDSLPDNGYALFGLAQALRAQHKEKAAAAVDKRFQEAWKYADHALSSSRY